MFPVNLGICQQLNYDCRKASDLMQMLFGIFPFVFLFSLITYKMKEETFRVWWNFAKWFVPTIIVITYLLQGVTGGGYLNTADSFSFAILFILYAVFVFVSIIKIVRAYRRSK
ncbi:MAG: hypothetical protein WCG84_04435 [Candidatus Moraniibacteriota bacterium]